MSLTMQVKHELARTEETLACCSSWELKALLQRHGYYTISQKHHILSLAVEDSVVARRIFALLRQAGVTAPVIVRQQGRQLHKNIYIIQVHGRDQIDALLVFLDLKEAGHQLSFFRRFSAVPRRACCRKAFLRGAFLAGGSISVSKKSGYHLEISVGDPDNAEVYEDMLSQFGLKPLSRIRKNNVYFYYKNAEAVADFLRVVGAGNTLLQLESQRVVKSMRNQVNRQVNCETANLEKVVASAQQQLDTIDQVDHRYGLQNLSPALQETALIRRKYPEASLKELGELLDSPVSKSAMNHRFRQLSKLISRQTP